MIPNAQREVVKNIRVSLGSAITIGLMNGILETKPTTIYLLTYHEKKCRANCQFCTQSYLSKTESDKLSRVTWPIFDLDDFLLNIKNTARVGGIHRICLQTINYQGMSDDLLFIVSKLRLFSKLPISISSQPLSAQLLFKLKKLGVDRICIPLDAATKSVFKMVKSDNMHQSYRWASHMKILENAVEIFHGNVSTHIIVGLGETDKELLSLIKTLSNKEILVSLFPFTPLKGTLRENHPKPSIVRYRILQLASYLIQKRLIMMQNFYFNDQGELINIKLPQETLKNLDMSEPFQTYGCEGCNRPYFTEQISGPIYNFPRKLSPNEIQKVKTILHSNYSLPIRGN
jgi:biotin synthase